jgi:hypothetical protein
MVNKKIWQVPGMLVVVLVFAMTVIGCNKANAGSLEGIWIAEDGSELELTDGNFEVRYDEMIIAKGTYSTDGNNKTLVNTHYNGLFLGFEPELLTKDELEAVLIDQYDFPIEEIIDFLDEVFETVVFEYTLVNNTLSWTMDGMPVISYTRKIITDS